MNIGIDHDALLAGVVGVGTHYLTTTSVLSLSAIPHCLIGPTHEWCVPTNHGSCQHRCGQLLFYEECNRIDYDAPSDDEARPWKQRDNWPVWFRNLYRIT